MDGASGAIGLVIQLQPLANPMRFHAHDGIPGLIELGGSPQRLRCCIP
jgi:hypothetical protein